MKANWAEISREVSKALRNTPEPKPTRKVIPIVVMRKSSLRAERAAVVLGRLA